MEIKVARDGRVVITSTDEEAARRALERVLDVAGMVEVGGIYSGRITRRLRREVLVRIYGTAEGLLPEDELAAPAGAKPEVGESVRVRVLGADAEGRLRLTRFSEPDGREVPSPNDPRESRA